MLDFPPHVDGHVRTENLSGGTSQEDLSSFVHSLASMIDNLATMQSAQGDMWQAVSTRLDKLENQFQSFLAMELRRAEMEQPLPTLLATPQPQILRLKSELMEEVEKLRGEFTFDLILEPKIASLKMELVEEIDKLRGELVIMGEQSPEHVAVPRSESAVSVEMSELKKEFTGQIKKLRDEMSVKIGGGASEQAIVAQREGFDYVNSRVFSDSETMEGLHKLPIQRLEESVWDAVLFIGLQGITVTHSCLLLVGITLNVLIQIGSIVILFRHMVNNPYDEQMLENLRRWKACQDTADQHPNTTVQPLPPNVGCVSIRLDVESVWTEVSNFFTVDEAYPAGWVMSMIATLAWAFAVAVEIRSICNFALGVWCVPRGSCTRIIAHECQFTLAAITRHRVWVVLAAAAMRLFIAANLLHWGTLNLIYQTDIGDLMLNACALAFILDIDGFVFAVVTPIIVARIARFLEPLPLPKAVNLAFATWLPVLAILAYVITIDLLYLRPFVHSMEDIIAIIDW